jgi:decaprenyl-phosphate phosphoribosyltransferase
MYSSTITNVKPLQSIWPYIQIARIDHWFKNTFMLLGVLVAFFYEPASVTWGSLSSIAMGLLATCLVASSNYVLNELLDGSTDRFHPEKKHRPVPSGKIQYGLAIVEWLVVGSAGVIVASLVSFSFFLSALILWLMGIAYNVPPVRTKELPYLDVLSESVNNPLRLFLGWFAVIPDKVPPISLILAYWMVGAFFMATKRFAEYRHIGDANAASQYRRSFGYYTENRLLVSMFFYAIICALFSGIFIVRYRVELILFVPLAAGFFGYYLKLGLQQDSPAQRPEKLYRERGFVGYLLFSMVVFLLLMLVQVPALYDLFNVQPARIDPLWTIGTRAQPRGQDGRDAVRPP